MNEETKILIVPPPQTTTNTGDIPKIVIVANGNDVGITAIEIRNENIQEILTKIPHWLIRRGNLLILTCMLLLLLLAWFIKYPSTIPIQITLNNEYPNQMILKEKEYIIEKILVMPNQKITAGMPLISIKTETDSQPKLITSLFDGVINYINDDPKTIENGEKIIEINNLKSGYYAIGQSDASNSGKIKEGNRVRIDLSDYTSNEIGTVFGTIESIYWDDEINKIIFYVKFSKQTNKLIHITLLNFKSLSIPADIIVEDKRLLYRLLSQ